MQPVGKKSAKYVVGITLGALGIVFGDIGTSPLYAFKECLLGLMRKSVDTPIEDILCESNILGILSLIIWTVGLLVALKYVVFVLRADNKGEGGILALASLVFSGEKKRARLRTVLLLAGVFGASLLYGDGIITPAISVLSAVEGFRVVEPGVADSTIIAVALVIIVGLFLVQKFGTGKVGRIFGPVMMLWFLTLFSLGAYNLFIHSFRPLLAFSPHYAIEFILTHPMPLWMTIMGAVFLAVTGGEALYADMGHFGIKPIRSAWWFIAMPALILNYLGQGALMLTASAPETVAQQPFFRLAPPSLTLPLVILATFATIIASQALISGAYSITMQAIQLGFLPRLKITHTNKHERGQIYIAPVNWFLMLACVFLVLQFRNSNNLASAYGVAVSITMMMTTLIFFFVLRDIKQWPIWKILLFCVPLFAIESTFVYANLLKFFHGGWFPLSVAVGIFTLMTTWRRGREVLYEGFKQTFLPLDLFLQDVAQSKIQRVPGTAIFMSGNTNVTPLALLHNLKHNKVLHQRVIILSIATESIPYVPAEERATIEKLDGGFYRIIGRYGYMEEIQAMDVLAISQKEGFECKLNDITFFLSRETIVHAKKSAFPIWREKIFATLNRNAVPATAYFKLPPNRVVELGMQIEI